MPKFKVDLAQTVHERTTLYIDADSEELAEQTALNIARGVIEPQTLQETPDWRCDEVQEEAEVIACQEAHSLAEVSDRNELGCAFERTRDLYSEG